MVFNALGIVGNYGGIDVVALSITVDSLVKGLTVRAKDQALIDVKRVEGYYRRFLGQTGGNSE
jgi:hypothetical protein